MSDRTPPGIEPGSDGRGWRALIMAIIIAPVALVIVAVAFFAIFALR